MRRKDEVKPFYRSCSSTLPQRCKKKLTEKTNWYKAKRKREDDSDNKADKKRTRRCQTEPRDCTSQASGGGAPTRNETKNPHKNEQVKTVMFVPYTEGSELAKRLREAEQKIQDMTGYRLKIVERAGTKLQDTLTKADPWQGMSCNRERCLLCSTKEKTGKNTTQDCTRRSLVYETWCITCYEKDLETVKQEAGEDKEKLKSLVDKIRKYKYIGETARSVFERSWEHLNDFQKI